MPGKLAGGIILPGRSAAFGNFRNPRPMPPRGESVPAPPATGLLLLDRRWIHLPLLLRTRGNATENLYPATLPLVAAAAVIAGLAVDVAWAGHRAALAAWVRLQLVAAFLVDRRPAVIIDVRASSPVRVMIV